MTPDIIPLGDRALLINFEQKIEPGLHQKVMDLASNLKLAAIEGITFVLPSYCSLTVGYDPRKIRYQELKSTVKNLQLQTTSDHKLTTRQLVLPVCYQDPYSLDLETLSVVSGLSPKEIIELHTTTSYRVYLMGFLPGFPYLGVLPEALEFPRKQIPRQVVPERSVGLAGQQTGIYPFESPGGWNIIGRTPLPIFNAHWEHPFLIEAGDQIMFHPISEIEYSQIKKDLRKGTFNWDTIYEPTA
jgi:inhibitor of KinA